MTGGSGQQEAPQMTHRVTFIPGDGVGPELSEATRRVLEATGVSFDWDVQEAGVDVMEKYGTPLPEHVLESIRSTGVGIKGPITTPVGTGFRSVNVALVICRENMEDLYAGIEFEIGKPETLKLIDFISELSGKPIREDSGLSIKPISVFGT